MIQSTEHVVKGYDKEIDRMNQAKQKKMQQ